MEQKIIDSLKDLLESNNDKNIILAANMMEDLDPDLSLFTHLYFHAAIRPKNEYDFDYENDNKGYKVDVRRIIKKYFEEEMLQIDDIDFVEAYDLKWSDEAIYKDFEYLQKFPFIDMPTFCRLCMIYYTKGGAYAVHKKLLSMAEVLPFYIKENKLSLNKFGLEEFPMEVLDHPQITELDLTENLIETFPKEISKLSMLTKIKYDEEKISSESIKTLEESLPKAMAYHYYTLGVDFYYEEKFEESLVMGEKSFELAPSDIMNLNLMCGVYSRLGQKEKAIDLLLKAHTQDPDHLLVLSNLGILYHSVGKDKEALEISETAINTHNRVGGLGSKDHAGLYFNKAQALFHLDRLDESLEIYENALSIHPRYGAAFFNVACIYARWEDKDKLLEALAEAIDCDKKIIKLAPKDTDFKAYWDDEDFIKLCTVEEEEDDEI